MIILCSTTARIPSETANSIQAVMACDGLSRCGQDVHLLIPGEGTLPFEELRRQYQTHCRPFPITRISAKASLHRIDFTLGALSYGKKIRAEAHYTWTIQVAAAAAYRGIPSAYEVHDLPCGGGIRWFDMYTRAKAPKKIICITRALRDRLLEIYPHLKAEDCLIMPNGFSPEDYEGLPSIEEAKRRMAFPAGRPAVSCSGHLYQGRGSGLFLDLAARVPDADFHWFGGTPEAVSQCREEARQRSLTNVSFHGNLSRTQLPLAQAACDILLMPYERQIAGSGGGNSAEICSPMKMFEYMAEGRCMLTSDLPVIREVLDERCAVFCEPEDIGSWTQALRAALDDPGRRAGLGAEAKRRSAAYTWQKRAEIYLNGSRND